MKLSSVSMYDYNQNYSNLKGNAQSSQFVGNVMANPNKSASSPSLNNLQAYFMPKAPSFGRLGIEHLQNGAYVDKAKNVFFKFFTFQDAKKAFVEIKNKGMFELEKTEDGIFSKKMASDIVKNGDDYRFKFIRGNGEEVYVKDPYAMRCKSLTDDYAQIYDHNEYKWSDDNWMNNKNNQKISRKSSSNGLLPLNKVKIYEENIATVTKEGNFEAAKAKIDELAKDKTFNAIHIMPVETTYSYNWGYDGVLKFAPQESQLGGPDKLKDLIDYAHSKNINVIMDVVPNHIGPDQNELYKSGPYLKPGGPFGDGFNLEGDQKNNIHVRDFLANTCLNWLHNYHCDGLRLDMTKFMQSDYALKQIAMEVHYHHPDAIIIAEDGRNNMAKLTKPLTNTEESVGQPELFHANQIKNVDNDKVSLDNIGMDSEWDFPFNHFLTDALAYDGSIRDFADARRASGHRIKYMMSHDEIGNLDGTRLITKMATYSMDMANKVEGGSTCEKAQRAAHATHAILESKVSGQFDKMTFEERQAFLRSHHVIQDVTPEQVNKVFNYAVSQHKLGLGEVFTSPGPNMVFQGDEKGALEYFKFFRQFAPASAEKDLINLSDKGYEPGIKAFNDSKMGAIPYSNESKDLMEKLNRYSEDLAKLRDENEALALGDFASNDVIHDLSKLFGSHLKKGDNEVFTINNFKDASYDGNYGIQFPEGKWQQVLNSNDAKYGGDGTCQNIGTINADGKNGVNIAIPANSLMVFKRVDTAVATNAAKEVFSYQNVA